jgi:hypothetical protein
VIEMSSSSSSKSEDEMQEEIVKPPEPIVRQMPIAKPKEEYEFESSEEKSEEVKKVSVDYDDEILACVFSGKSLPKKEVKSSNEAFVLREKSSQKKTEIEDSFSLGDEFESSDLAFGSMPAMKNFRNPNQRANSTVKHVESDSESEEQERSKKSKAQTAKKGKPGKTAANATKKRVSKSEKENNALNWPSDESTEQWKRKETFSNSLSQSSAEGNSGKTFSKKFKKI